MSTKGRILICDNDSSFSKGVKGTLSKEGYSVVSAFTTSKSIQYLKEDQKKQNLRDRFSVVIVDLDFEEADDSNSGFKILDVARTDPLLESIVCTGIGSELLAVKAITVGVFGYIMKNASGGDGADLLQTVVRANQLHKECLDLLEEIDRLAATHPDIPAIRGLAPHFVDYVRNVRGRGR
jgi:ActR/RegA family two-component response regulator